MASPRGVHWIRAGLVATLVTGCFSAPPDGQSVEALTYCPGPTTVQGVDVSEYQRSIDWGAVARSGRGFAVARVGDGDYVDPYFAANWAGIRGAGLVRGVYQFFRPELDPVHQADILLAAIGSLQPGDLPPVLDIEVVDGVSPGTYNARIHAWVDRIQSATGVPPMLYVGSYFWNDHINTGDFASLPLWLPAYGPVCPLLPNPWTRWRIHQYSSTGAVPGISGNVDVDVFDGDLNALRALAVRATCSPHCEGTVIVAGDCSRGDCAAYGSQCTQAGGAPHCIAPDRGSLDGVGCARISGWAQDPNAAGNAISVRVYFDGPSGTGSGPVTVSAGDHRDDLCTAIGSCNHGFSLSTPASLRDGQAHTVYAYAVGDTGAGEASETLLGGAPKTLQCALPQLADFNGDGRSDLIAFRADWQSVPVCASLGSGWSCRNLPATVTDDWTGGNNGSGVSPGARALLGHFNADRWADLVEYIPGNGETVPVCDSLVSGWSCRGLSGDLVIPAPGGTGLLGDINGDGLDDLVQYVPGASTLPVCLSLATGWSCRDLPGLDPGSASAVGLLGDFNADGKKDFLRYDSTGTTLPLCLSLGTGWSCRDLPAVYVGDGSSAGNQGSGVFPGSVALVGDVNGDGRDDVVQYNPASVGLPVCLSLGTGWSCRTLAANYAGGDYGSGNGGGGIYPGGIPLMGDFNGDGRMDLAQYNDGWSSIPVCLSLATGWSCRNLAADFTVGDLPAGNQGSGIYPGGTPLVGDVNGDGRADVVQYQSQDWTGIPVCLSLGSGWSCRNLPAPYDGGIGAGNNGSGVY